MFLLKLTESTCNEDLLCTALRNKKKTSNISFKNFVITSNVSDAIVIVATTTKSLLRINTKLPIELMSATRKLLLIRILNACCLDWQKFLPCIAEKSSTLAS